MKALGFGRYALGIGLSLVLLAGCGGGSQGQGSRSVVPAADRNGESPLYADGKINHVIVVIQENRSVDNLFNGLPGADTVNSGKNSKGQEVKLVPQPLTAKYDIKHNHRTFQLEYNHGEMNGFDLVRTVCKKPRQCPPPGVRAYAYVPRDDIKPYFDMGEQYTFADEMFQTNQGPSFPAHQYLVSGTSTIYDGAGLKVAENPGKHLGGCDSPTGTLVALINAAGQEGHKTFPCFDRTSIFTLLDEYGVTWRYYQNNPGARLWNAVDALKPIWQNKTEYNQNVIVPSSQVLKDISNGNLAQVVMVTPSAAESDHSGVNNGTGPEWVASIVNTVGATDYWRSTVIFVTWDDWGGWFDHANPTIYNSYELGFRVPLLVISPYAKQGYVSHVPYEFGSILKFIEENFNVGSLGTTDVRANDLYDCFDFSKPNRSFRLIRAKRPARYFLHLPPDNEVPDAD